AERRPAPVGASHPEYTEPRRFGFWCAQPRAQGLAKHGARIDRIDDAVVPQARSCIKRIALSVVLGADRRLERLFILAAPFAALGLDRFLAQQRQHGCGLFAAHYRDTRIGPHEEETRPIGAACHAVVAGTM